MPFSVIFDLDGTIVDNAEFHKKAWKEFCNSYNKPFSNEIFNTVFFGKTNHQVLPELFGKKFTFSEAAKLSKEKEIIYRKIFQKEMKPVKDLIPFLKDLKENNIKIALATSAPPVNIDFVLSGLNIKNYFSAIVDDTMVKKGKPDPEIFIKASNHLNRKPEECVVFEDSLAGTKAATDAGCKVVALTTSIAAVEHKYYNIIIPDYSKISVNFIQQNLFNE